MKKLKNKVFLVLFFILTLFLFTILVIFNYQDYSNEVNLVRSNLLRLDNMFNRREEMLEIPNVQYQQRNEIKFEQRIFMDSSVYTVVLDNDNNIIDIVSHTVNGLDEEKITSIARNIIDNKDKNDTKVGNLYFTDYSYSFKNNNSLVIIDNQKTQERLYSILKTSIIIFTLLELVIIYVSIKLTSWIIKPVVESFNKQKQFVADASHELKTPLAVIMASADALENDLKETKWLNNIKSESERMNKLISNLLDLAKLENGISKKEYSLSNLSKLVEMSILTFEAIIYEKNIKLNYNIEENINLSCNSEQIKQLMVILIDNAIKHSIKDGEININLLKERNSYILEVKNKGKEIPKGEEEKIFERFYKVDESRNRDDNRYGLGLAIAKSIVLNHNGKISANSNDGYTTFRVEFKQV